MYEFLVIHTEDDYWETTAKPLQDQYVKSLQDITSTIFWIWPISHSKNTNLSSCPLLFVIVPERKNPPKTPKPKQKTPQNP